MSVDATNVSACTGASAPLCIGRSRQEIAIVAGGTRAISRSARGSRAWSTIRTGVRYSAQTARAHVV